MRMYRFFKVLGMAWVLTLAGWTNLWAQAQSVPQRLVHGLLWDVHEVTIGQVRHMANQTGFVSQAEREGGGYVYEAGWTRKSGWHWQNPYGVSGRPNEPATHLSFDEAQQICRYFGKRLPKDSEWTQAAYLEQRQPVAPGWEQGKRYRYPNGDSALGSQCLDDCGSPAGVAPPSSLWRGTGHVPVMTSRPGVNGLWDMGGNVWEWVDDGTGDQRITRGASWWYGAEQQLASNVATKPKDTRVVYIGFRCVQAP